MAGLINTMISWILYLIAYALGLLSRLISELIFWAAGFQDFTTLTQISRAWMVMRDFSNMFFIIILLIIAFGTVLKIEAYSYKKLLPRMLIMAILINFSKTICGIIIDASEVFMLTFLNAMAEVQGGGLLRAFGLTQLMTPKTAGDALITDRDVVFTLLLVVALLAVACVVYLVFAVMLLLRVCMLWLLIILSPLAYVLNVLPQTEKYAKDWWQKFGNYVILGPMITFFLWLAIYVASYRVDDDDRGIAGQMSSESDLEMAESKKATVTNATSPELIANFIIATMLLLGGLQMTTQLATEFSKVTGQVTSLGTRGMMWMGRRLDDTQNYLRMGAGAAIGWGGRKMAESGEANNKRGRHAAGGIIQGIGKTLGAQMTLRPSELKKTFQDVTSRWDEEKMGTRRGNLRQAMATAMAPGRWGVGIHRMIYGEELARQRQNAGDVKGIMSTKVMEALKAGDTDAVGEMGRDEIDKAYASLKGAIKNMQERSKDINYSDEEKQQMAATITHLTGLKDNLDNGEFEDMADALKEGSTVSLGLGGFEKRADALQGRLTTAKKVGGVAAFYAGEADFMNAYMQNQAAEESTKLEEKTGGIAEPIVLELEEAFRQGNTSKIMACMRSLWNTNDQNELHNSKFLMKHMREVVKKKADMQAKRKNMNEEDTKQLLEDTTTDFEQNYTDPAYMNMFLQEMLGKAFKDNKSLMAKEAMRLDQIAIEQGGGHYYGTSMVDAATGQGIFNDPSFKKGVNGKFRAMISVDQAMAIKGKLSNLDSRYLSGRAHPGRFATRRTVGGPGGMTSSSFINWKSDDAEQYSRPESMRKDFIDQITDPNVLQEMTDFFAAVEGGDGKEFADAIVDDYDLDKDDLKRGKIRAVILSALGMGEVEGSKGREFFVAVMQSTDDITAAELKAISESKGDDRRQAIRRIMNRFGKGAKPTSSGGGSSGGGGTP